MEHHQNDTVPDDLQDFDELMSDDELSLCDLPIDDHEEEEEEEEEESHLHGPENSSPELDLFEFVVKPDHETRSTSIPDPIVFCGKTIPDNPITHDLYRNPMRNGHFLRRECSFKRSRSFRSEPVKTPFVAAKRSPVAVGNCGYGYRRPISGDCRKQKVLIGLVKFQPEMEMSEIRKRQSRRIPAKMFPATEGGEVTVIGDGNVESVIQWGLLFKPFRCRTHFLSTLTKASFRCMQHA